MARYIKLDKIEPLPIDTIKSDDVIGDAQKTLEEWITEAYFKAIHEGIKANTVMISEHFAKVNEFPVSFGYSTSLLPPMICGLQVYVSRDLPDGYDFGLVEAPMTEREAIANEAERKAAREIFEEIENAMELNILIIKNMLNVKGGRANGKTILAAKYDAFSETKNFLAELKKKYTEEQHDG